MPFLRNGCAVLPEFTFLLYNRVISEINFLYELIEKTNSILNDYYESNVLYGKYHNFVAVSSICDYLSSGRCDSLEGPDGAYNLFEMESRTNLIINKLDIIIDSLDQIKQNQYLLYKELQSINDELYEIKDVLLINDALQAVQTIQLQDIANSNRDIANNTEEIVYNTAASAYYTKQNTKLLDAIGFMTALN